MNQVFSFKRFGMLFRKHTVEHFKGYLMSLFVLTALLATVLIAVSYASGKRMDTLEGLSGQAVIFVLFLYTAGTMFTSTVFSNLGNKKQAIAVLTLPCTLFEKYFVAWLYSFIIFQVVYIMVFYAIAIPVLHTGNWPVHLELTNVFTNTNFDTYISFTAFAFLHSVMFFGAIYFKKMHFIKTAFVLFIIVLVIWLLNDQVLRLLIHHQVSGNPPFAGANFKEGISSQSIELNWENLAIALFGVLSVMMWCAAYFRLKEKQV